MSSTVPDLDLLDGDVEGDLRAAVRDLLADACSPRAVAALYDGDRSLVEPLWSSVGVTLGLAGLLAPESLGGAGGSAVDAAVVMEELGRSCAPVPFLTSSVIALSTLIEGDADAAPAALSEVARGERTAAVVVPWSTGPGDELGALTLLDGRVSGRVRSVAGALEADLLIVPAHSSAGLISLHLVEQSAVVMEPVISLDMSRQVADLSFDGARATLFQADGEAALRHALLLGSALLASEQVGVARWCLEETVAYLKVRRQFGRAVGGFQAIKHRLANLYAQVESASATARYAAAAIASDTDVAISAHVAASYCSEVAVHAAEEAVQLHGGIGMTWEHPAHLYLKRAKASQIALGSPESHRRILGSLVNITLDSDEN